MTALEIKINPGYANLHSNAFNKFRDALGLSIQAASVAFCVMESSLPDALRRTRDVYGRALTSQNKLLSGLGRFANSATPTPQMTCTTVMLSYYESHHDTTPGRYVRHLDGAAETLPLAGPEACRQG